ncbi:acyltransferase family protein [Bdellovibrio sp. HCB2-146]|uniref:acyltransferase family protein n=1 Tax=Bdellovibrio sp. HCB2-146 TaxID=3394362 RepID=UPI0039BD2D29
MSQKTNHSVDSLKGALIFLVVFGHMIERYLTTTPMTLLFRSIYLFHMPAFVFLAGITSKKDFSKQNFLKITQGVVLPLAVFNFLYEGISFASEGHLSEYITRLAPYWALWFLLSLAIWRSSAPLFSRVRFPLFFSTLIAIMAGCFSIIGYPLGLSRTFVFLPFFVAGLCYGSNFLVFIEQKRNSRMFWLGAFLLLMLPIVALPYLKEDLLRGAKSFSAMNLSYTQGITNRATGYVLAAIAFVPFVLTFSRMSWLEKFGRASFQIFLWHGFFRKVLVAQTFPTDLWGENSFIELSLYCFAVSALMFWGLSVNMFTVATRAVLKPFETILLGPSLRAASQKDSA